MSRQQPNLPLRIWNALVGPSWLRDGIIVSAGALLSAGLIFGVLYDASDAALRRWSDRDLNRRAHLIGVAVASHAQSASPAAMQKALDSLSASEDAANLALCSADRTLIAATGVGRNLGCNSGLGRTALRTHGRSLRARLGERSVVVTAHTIGDSTLFVLQDRSFVDTRRKHLLQVLAISAEVAVLALIVLARAGSRIGSRRMEAMARSIVRQMRADGSRENVPAELRLLARDVRDTVEHLRVETQAVGGAERLRALAGAIPSGGLVVIANREPYAHEYGADGEVIVKRPASGLVTGIEPILRACGGTWIAYGGGSADQASSDRSGKVAVPPEAPEYTLRRLWIGMDDYERYYLGFANEGLWPLCHTAYTQPAFRSADWTSYQAVNETFARAALDETASDAMLLIQDYHFALVPRMVRDAAPHVVTSLFWHIPWPNSEVFGICPWKDALLEGMTGADVVGFHTKQYCLNFLDTLQRYLECRVDLEEMSVTHRGHRTLVRTYPISVEWPYPAAPREEGAAVRRALGIPVDAHVSVGVDRADYTKGLLERVAAIEVLLEQNRSLADKYVFVQLASPTRTRIRRYQQFTDELKEAVERVNARFGTDSWQPIILQMRTFSPEQVREYYAMADSALVTPLHDGMNLVAKEYAASCDDCDGVLVLSSFAGAARELEGALIVNPYDTQQLADAILRAVRMPLAERRSRMQSMRAQIAASSIYDWSEKLLTDLRDVRQSRKRFWPKRSASSAGSHTEVIAG